MPEFPDTPAGDLDRLAYEEGWVLDEDASAWIGTMCGEFDRRKEVGQWLTEERTPTPDEEAALEAGMPELCPRWWPEVSEALGVVVKRAYPDGTYEVSGEAGSDETSIEPGTYRTVNPGEDCYWERASVSGEVLGRRTATAEKSLTVTVRATDGFFTSKRCGTWKSVR